MEILEVQPEYLKELYLPVRRHHKSYWQQSLFQGKISYW